MKLNRTPSDIRARLRMRLAMLDSLSHLALLSVLVGLLSGAVIIAFRLIVESVQAGFLPGGDPENYEGLSWWWRLLLPIAGGFIIGIIFQAMQPKNRQVGVVHVMERLAYHQARLPIVNAVMQFFGAAVAIIFGHSVGREGPAVHLGATSGSQLGQWLRLPNNSTRILVACGVAAAIAASFNTPLAGVIFSMEVVLMEYTLAGFIPVILAAVTATALCQYFFGNEPAFSVPAMQLGSLGEIPFVLITGLFIGCLAALFIHSLRFFSNQLSDKPFWQRTTVAGVLVGICAVFVPQVMSIGYDTVTAAMLGELGFWLLLAILVFKIFATTAGLGLGLPGGLIGPTLVVGAAAGGLVGVVAAMISPETVSSPAFYAMIGMGAMMGATLQAPLAALTAILELTANPNVILPGMLAIVGAGLVSSQLFKKNSVFIELAKARGLDYHDNPVAQSLRRVSVAKAMDQDVVECEVKLTRQEADALLRQHPHWVVVRDGDEVLFAMPGSELARHLKTEGGEGFSLAEIPAVRHQVAAIDLRASLQEAQDVLSQQHMDMLYVADQSASSSADIFGVLTREDIEEHYRYPGG